MLWTDFMIYSIQYIKIYYISHLWKVLCYVFENPSWKAEKFNWYRYFDQSIIFPNQSSNDQQYLPFPRSNVGILYLCLNHMVTVPFWQVSTIRNWHRLHIKNFLVSLTQWKLIVYWLSLWICRICEMVLSHYIFYKLAMSLSVKMICKATRSLVVWIGA
jgi:hypothetical protein